MGVDADAGRCKVCFEDLAPEDKWAFLHGASSHGFYCGDCVSALRERAEARLVEMGCPECRQPVERAIRTFH